MSQAATPAPDPEATLGAALMLSFVGGFLDVFTFIGHGGVFANAQTGNAILLGSELARGNWPQALRHLPAIVAFLAGIFCVHLMQRVATRRLWRGSLLALAIETALILAIGLLPREVPDFWVVIAVSFAASLQFAGFPTVQGWAYTSVVTTGNLRRLMDALFAFLVSRDDPHAGARTRAFALIFLAFIGGAAAGTLATLRLRNPAALVPAGCLLTLLVRCVLAERRKAAASS